ncbi:hypothetical protein TIFTF001_006054 [Ficus carica]|uniref:F-box associated beta-propeller type 1 domain-containing protein n=1 Tax=Ficus carica TaxID=3494 RepID=A0AA87ZNE3_FICCA|nr:hypothetical protein TIFTF001_006054 [Ficus carica]
MVGVNSTMEGGGAGFLVTTQKRGRYKKLPVTNDVDFPDGFSYHGFHFHGFEHDPINDNYKLVRVTQFHGELEHSFDSVVDVYSSKSDSWTRKKGFLPYILGVNIPNGVLVGNALHWMASRWSKSDDSKFIVAFDLVTEKYREIPTPKFQKNGTIEVSLEVLGSSLCVTCNYIMPHYFLGVYEDFVLSLVGNLVKGNQI